MDMTERKLAEEALRQSEERWKAVFEHNPTMYFMVDVYGTIVSVNSFGATQLGYAVDELVGRAVLEVFPEDDREAVQANLAACFEQLGHTMRWELRKLRKDGSTLWVRETAKAEVIKKRPLALIVAEDVSESKQAREDLRDSETRYRNIFQTVGVSIWEEDFSQVKAAIDALRNSGVQDFRRYLAANPHFVEQAVSMIRVVDVNDVTLKLFAAPSKQELLASPHKIFVPETRDLFVEELGALAEGRTFFEAETVLQTLAGARLNVLFTITFPQADARARFDGVLVTITDVTEQRKREREREEMERQLQQAARMEAIGRLAGGIAHDFNNILGAILGYGELAQKNLEGRAVRRHVDQVMLAGARGKGLVERILAFSRSGLGERTPLHVQSVVEETLELLSASLPSKVQLRKSLDAADAAVVGDATQLHQVAMNLCTNAVQAIGHGGVLTVRLDRAELHERRVLSHGTLPAGAYVRLCVTDTGPGIPPAVLERMFDPFFTTKRVGDGTGLGLALVHGLVADFGGAIDVATQSGMGTTFTVWLPAAGETPRPVAEPAVELPQGNGETVMIVDDESALVALAEETLAALGYEPAGFESSVAALEAFRAEPRRFDLVLTDVTMPDLGGVELACEIRRVRPELPIVLMSGYSGGQLGERAQAAGVAEVLRKPLVARDIADALGRALRPANNGRATAFDNRNGGVA
jgi:PAS domain S-box-containing protein